MKKMRNMKKMSEYMKSYQVYIHEKNKYEQQIVIIGQLEYEDGHGYMCQEHGDIGMYYQIGER